MNACVSALLQGIICPVCSTHMSRDVAGRKPQLTQLPGIRTAPSRLPGGGLHADRVTPKEHQRCCIEYRIVYIT